MGIELVVLDWDGVINDSRDLFVGIVNHTLVSYGVPPVTVDDISRTFRPDPQSFYADRGIRDWPRVRELQDAHYRAIQHQIALVPGVREALSALSRLVPLCILTSNDEQNVRRDIARYGLGAIVQHVIGNAHKGRPDDFERLLSLAGVPKERVIYGGDTSVDIQFAHLAGVNSVGIVHPDYAYQALELVAAHRLVPTHGIVEHVRDIIPLVKNGF